MAINKKKALKCGKTWTNLKNVMLNLSVPAGKMFWNLPTCAMTAVESGFDETFCGKEETVMGPASESFTALGDAQLTWAWLKSDILREEDSWTSFFPLALKLL